MKQRILGLDPSLNRTGWAIVDFDGKNMKLVDYGFIDCSHFDAELEESKKIKFIYDTMMSIYRNYKPTHVISESPFFSRKNENVKTLMRLSHVHGTLLLVAELNNKEMEYYAPLTIKSVVLGGLKKKSEKNTKEEVANAVFEVFPQRLFIKEYTNDVTDAIAVILTYIKKEGKGTQKENALKRREKNESKSSGKKTKTTKRSTKSKSKKK